MKHPLLALMSVVAVSSAALFAATDGEPKTTQSGVYSVEQAERGAVLYEEACLACHETDEFAQPGYMEGWAGMSVNDFMQLIRTTMPQDNPGRLKRDEYVDIVAFMFQESGLPTGEEEMDPKSIVDIRIEGPFGSE